MSADADTDSPMAGYVPNLASAPESLAAAPTALGDQSGTSGFVAADRFGNAVACMFSMNGLFGTGRVAPGTGIVLAAPPAGGAAGSPLLPVIALNEPLGSVVLAATASGGAASTLVARLLAEVLEDDGPLADAIARGRVHHPGVPHVVLIEAAADSPAAAALTRRGHDIRVVPALGRVNAFLCPGGLRNNPGRCEARTDPRGFGLAGGG